MQNINFKVYPRKIDIYLRNRNGSYTYETSTMAAETCKHAKQNFCARHCLDKSQVKANFAK